ncbi:MAG: hypothetical protein IMY67_00820 [Bacteroidetes bacterium]|nr:hypothetical protein [Bacteroidota bacterium]
MNEIKSYILEFIWSGKGVSHFEQWLYEQNSIEFEKLFGESNYIELVSFDYKKKTVDQIKQFVKTILPDTLIQEFEAEFEKRKSKAIKGKCLKKEALDYYDKKNRNWDVEVGKEYEFLIINTGIQKGNHPALVNYVDRTNYFQPSGFIPMELFEIDLDNISEFYHKVSNTKSQTRIELEAFSDKQYKPTQYSFWEDFYNDDDKAVNTYFDTIDKLGIKNVW